MQHPNNGKEIIYKADGLPIWVLHSVQAVAAVALFFTCIVAYEFYTHKTNKFWFNIYWIFWVFAPPLWFSFEYFILYKNLGQDGTFEAFKYGQDLAFKVWVGIATVLTVIAAK